MSETELNELRKGKIRRLVVIIVSVAVLTIAITLIVYFRVVAGTGGGG
jgi:hypothetical protein